MVSLQRVVADVYSTAVFRELAAARPGWRARSLHVLSGLSDQQATLGDVLDRGFAYLQREYRCEYVFKNTVATALAGGREDTAVILEQAMGKSYADVTVIADGIATYEIKTDLDSFTRLPTQLADYSSHSGSVSVVTSDTRADMVLPLLPAHVGLLTLSDEGGLDEVRPPVVELDRVNTDSLYHLLRHDEAVAVLRETVGYELDVPRGEAWKRMRSVFTALPTDVVYPAVADTLRHRSGHVTPLIADERFPKSLIGLAYGLTTLSNVGGRRILDRLNQPYAAAKAGW